MRAARTVTVLIAVFATACAVVSAVAEIRVQTASGVGVVGAVPTVLLSVAALTWALAGAVLVWHRPSYHLGWLMLAAGTVTQASVAVETGGRAGWSVPGTGELSSFAAGLLLFVTVGLLPLLYPSRLPGRGATAAAGLVVVGALVMQVQWLLAQRDPTMTWAFGPPSDDVAAWVVWSPVAVYAAGVVLGWVLCVRRLLRAGYPERQQLAWLLVAVVFLLVTMTFGDAAVAVWLQAVAVPLVAAAIVVGVLRYRALGIETALPRAITYIALVGAVSGVYLAITAWAGVQLTGSVLPAVVGAALLAVGLLPLRSRAEALVERFLYGSRADAVAAVAHLSTETGTSEQLLELALERVATAFRARGAVLLTPDGVEHAQVGVNELPTLTADLVAGGAHLGTIGLVPRRPGEPFARRDAEGLAVVAAQVGLLWRAVRNADALQEQRDAVVAATRAERDRLRRDLHDGLGPSLTGVGLGLQALRDALGVDDVRRAAELTGVLHEEMERSVAEVRRVLDDLRPGDLDGGGLEGALRRRADAAAATASVRVDVAGLPPLEPRVEDAVYRVLSEAVTNALKHADAGDIAVDVSICGPDLVATVIDDGSGVPSPTPAGIGLVSMSERARAVGGRVEIESGGTGTTVTLRVPVEEPA